MKADIMFEEEMFDSEEMEDGLESIMLERRMAYVRQVSVDEVMDMFPEAPEIPQNQELWALLDVQGQPIALAGSESAAKLSAMRHDIETVSVH
ncbi:DUF1150 domain-containing protein [Cohaesibacter celericrescens]|uniref:DUF1150 domain-containing protein n=2 Tax=Cohaesibacter celericrescens TaxID=2067669 RepID=A0A2N5XN03_9HYPH|nr:DUF1150 domain-containing protein [Cohaesibacter celericrescens]